MMARWRNGVFQTRRFFHLIRWSLGLLWTSHWASTLAIAVLTLIQSLIPILQLWIAKRIIDRLVAGLAVPVATRAPDWANAIWVNVGLEAAILIGGLLLGLALGHARNILQEHLVYEVQLRVLSQAATLDMAVYESPTYYDHLARAQEEARHGPIQLLGALLLLGQATFTLLSMVSVIVLYQPWIVPLLLLTTIPSFALMLHYGEKRFVLFNTRTPDGRRAEYLSTALASDIYAKEIRVWGLTDYFLNQIRALRGRFRAENIALSREQATATVGGELLSTLGYYSAYVSVIIGAVTGRLTIGDLTLYAGVFSRSQSLFEETMRAIAAVYELQLFIENLAVFLDLKPTLTTPDPLPMTPLSRGIEVKNLSFRYPDTEAWVLRDLSFTIGAGECVAVVGTNGAGKTTLVKCLLRLYDPDGGAIQADGHDLRRLDVEAWRSQVGVVFQDYARYQLPVRENIGVGNLNLLYDDDAIRHAAQHAGIAPVLEALPEGYDTPLGRQFVGGVELSLGQWQRVALARALLRDAPFLILDEPTAAMDAQAEYDLYRHFREMARGRMTLLISHRFSTVRMADRILVLEDGHIIEEGTHDDLLARNGRYANLFNLQAESYQPTGSSLLSQHQPA